MCAHMHVRMYLCTHAREHVCTSLRVLICTHIGMIISMSILMCLYARHACVCVHMRVHMRAHMRVHMRVRQQVNYIALLSRYAKAARSLWQITKIAKAIFPQVRTTIKQSTKTRQSMNTILVNFRSTVVSLRCKYQGPA